MSNFDDFMIEEAVKKNQEISASVDEIARLRKSNAQLLEALVQLEEEVDSLRKGITWSRDYIGVIQAQLRAKEAIRSAKGAE